MKKQLLLFFFLCSFGFADAQTSVYHPFPNDSLVWFQARAYGIAMFSYEVTQLLGDTTFNELYYKKVFRSGPLSTMSYTAPLAMNYLGAFREDVPDKKVYFMYANDTTEHLLYNFNLGPGDMFSTSGYDTLIVIAVDSVLVSGSYHRSLVLANATVSPFGEYPGELIEGVGSTEGLLDFYYKPLYGLGSQLMCFSYKGMRHYPNSGSGPNCALLLGISDLSDGKITISLMPNPTSATVNLSINCTDSYAVEVINSAGERLYSGKERLSSSVIDLSGYAPGIYFIRISDSKGNSATKKIVKQ